MVFLVFPFLVEMVGGSVWSRRVPLLLEDERTVQWLAGVFITVSSCAWEMEDDLSHARVWEVG